MDDILVYNAQTTCIFQTSVFMILENSTCRAVRHSLLTLCLFLLISERASAVGFMVNAPSQVTGLANAGSAVYDRSTAAITNNPAAMSLLDGEQIGGNLTAVFPDWEVNEGWDCKAENSCSSSSR